MPRTVRLGAAVRDAGKRRLHYSGVMNATLDSTLGGLDRAGLSLERLRAFLRVADAGGISLAAPRDPTRQSLISRQISELEAALEQPLFARSGRRMTLTPAGRMLAAVVRELHRGLSEVVHTAAQPLSLSLGAGDSVLHGWVLPRLARRPLTARLTVTALASDDLPERLADGRLDFGVWRGASAPQGLRARRLGAVSYPVFAARSLAKRLGAQVLEAPLALQTSEPRLHARLLKLAEARGGARELLLCDTFPQVARALEAGRHVGVLPSFGLGESPAGLVQIDLPDLAPLTEPLALLWSARKLAMRPSGDLVASELHAALSLNA
jgi:DNA-binding transcriptional LysR family regulator